MSQFFKIIYDHRNKTMHKTTAVAYYHLSNIVSTRVTLMALSEDSFNFFFFYISLTMSDTCTFSIVYCNLIMKLPWNTILLIMTT